MTALYGPGRAIRFLSPSLHTIVVHEWVGNSITSLSLEPPQHRLLQSRLSSILIVVGLPFNAVEWKERAIMSMAGLDKTICHINLARGYRGGERQTELLVRGLAQQGWTQRLVIRKGSPLAEHCAGIDALEIAEVMSNQVAAGLAARGSALIHAHDARSVDSGLLASLLFDIPYILTRRVVNPQKKSWRRDKGYRRAANIIAISRAAADEMRKQQPYVTPTIIRDAHATMDVDAAQVAAIRKRRPGKTLIGHVGALEHSHKGQLTIIEVAREAVHSRPDWHFLLVGRGNDEARFREAMNGLENIELVGFVDNIGDYLSAFDLFVFPSLHEALGSTLVDAMHFGLPIVATNVGGIPEIIDDGTNGRLVQPERVDQLYDAMAFILDDESRVSSISQANKIKAADFGAERMVDAYEEIYRQIL